ncbi:MAG: LytR/AlgR family response regulator transcription factor [Ginsengibacter sp.]
MIKVLIIDDEQHCIDRLVKLLIPSHNDLIEISGTALTVSEGIEKIALFNPDLIFLDVQIGNKTGFDLLREIPDRRFAIIFTTGYEKFAIQAIKFSALDYLLKPVDEADLNVSLMKFMNEHTEKQTSQKIDILLQNIQDNRNSPKKIIVPTVNGLEFLDIADIVRCQSEINYTTIHLRDKGKIVVAKTLKEFEQLLPGHSFFRVHNSHLLNLAYIKSYNKGKGGSVKLLDGTIIEVSSRRKDDFIKRLSMF